MSFGSEIAAEAGRKLFRVLLWVAGCSILAGAVIMFIIMLWWMP